MTSFDLLNGPFLIVFVKNLSQNFLNLWAHTMNWWGLRKNKTNSYDKFTSITDIVHSQNKMFKLQLHQRPVNRFTRKYKD